ncbi:MULTISPECIES: DUF3021 domain-containing protein [Halobacillus]|uniref:DUF3021 domain-containing protein n=1 Tax=Halobacillus TaxID=45667 RepID=UPI001371B0A9|nr:MULTISPECIES: DUF3021 domain-containing protein [Halobacillus]MCA1022408.1 DUF3021 domain-containing protein [Halobacillus litoralis]MYL30448.1 DUF3021 family protein [Halobacillus halophilus]MYL38816.1 DUF3021 family protein [Halobacillus litoralis]
MKTFLIRSAGGIFFGAFLSTIIVYALIFFGDTPTLDSGTFVKNSLASMAAGWLFAVSPLYFEIQPLSLLQQTLLHFITVTTGYFPLAVYAGWLSLNIGSFLIFTAVFLMIYAGIWTGFYFYYRTEAEDMNESLDQLQE